jgi:hypothetical protein
LSAQAIQRTFNEGRSILDRNDCADLHRKP